MKLISKEELYQTTKPWGMVGATFEPNWDCPGPCIRYDSSQKKFFWENPFDSTRKEITEEEAIHHLQSWGIYIKDNLDIPKIRRRVEDYLRKTNPEEIISIAVKFNIKLEA